MRHCLVVAHQTLDSPRLAEAMLEEASRGPCSFHLVVPLLNKGDGLTWTEAEIRTTARDHLDQALGRFTAQGFAIVGEIGSSTSPVDSVTDVLLRHGPDFYDLVIVSTLPHAVSRWLHIDAPSRIERATGLPVRHVEAP
ncbi:MAG TPA: hypothetical protein VIY72_13470, partial [Acidimicrobiales bacterium]